MARDRSTEIAGCLSNHAGLSERTDGVLTSRSEEVDPYVTFSCSRVLQSLEQLFVLAVDGSKSRPIMIFRTSLRSACGLAGHGTVLVVSEQA